MSTSAESKNKIIAPLLAAKPLYSKVRDEMVGRMVAGHWSPGHKLPSEIAIAAELGVHQGTVRKALDELAQEGLVVRQQGKGTFVADAADNAILFRFFRLTPNSSLAQREKVQFPKSQFLRQEQDAAIEQEQDIFKISAGSLVWRFERVRFLDEKPILWEKLVLPAERFPDFSTNTELPNNVYQFYGARYKIIVANVREELRAVLATETVASHLNLETGCPLLEIDRQAVALDGQTIEWRQSLCQTETMHYRNEL